MDRERRAVRRFTVDEALRMVDAGIIGEDEPFELLDGVFVDSDATTGEEIVRRFSGDEAVRLVEAGIIDEDDRVELLDGAFVEMSPQDPVHAAAITHVATLLRAAYGPRALVREEKPLAATPYSLPEPDIAVVRGSDDWTYVHRHPSGPDTLLVVEVAWSSQAGDRRKAQIYASAGVSTYWLLDLSARRLEVYAEPVEHGYRVTTLLSDADATALPGSDRVIDVRDLLPTSTTTEIVR